MIAPVKNEACRVLIQTREAFLLIQLAVLLITRFQSTAGRVDNVPTAAGDRVTVAIMGRIGLWNDRGLGGVLHFAAKIGPSAEVLVPVWIGGWVRTRPPAPVGIRTREKDILITAGMFAPHVSGRAHARFDPTVQTVP